MRLPFSSYSATRLDVDVQRRVNVYPHSKGGVRQFPGLVEFGDAKFDQPVDSGETGTLPSNRNGIQFNTTSAGAGSTGNGTNLYTLETGGDKIYDYPLSTGWDISTLNSTPTASFTFVYPGVSSPDRFCWSWDGLRLYVRDGTTIYQHNASTAWDVTALAYASKSFSVSTESSGGPIWISKGGTRFFVGSGSAVYGYQLSGSAFEFDNVNFRNSLDVSAEITNIEYIGVEPRSSDGTELILTISGLNGLFTQWNLGNTGMSTLSTSTFRTAWTPLITLTSWFAWGVNLGDQDGSALYVGREYASTTLITQYDTMMNSLGDGNSDARGGIVMDGIPYVIIQHEFDKGTLHSFDSNGDRTDYGTISGSGRAGMETDGTQLIITTGTTPSAILYKFTVAGGLVQNTDSDLDESARTSAYIDLRFIYDQPDGKFAVSSLTNAINIDPQDIAEAESFDDDLLAVYAHNELIYFFGEKFLEVWFTSGVGRPPIDRQKIIERGIIGSYAVTSIDDSIYWMDHTRRFNKLEGLEYEIIAPPAFGDEIESYTTVSDVVALSYSFEHENFIEFVFPSADVTWTYHEPSKTWTKREDSSNNRYRAGAYLEVYNKMVILDRSTTKLYDYNKTTYQDDGSAITRTIDTVVVSSELDEVANKRIDPKRLKLTISALSASTISVSQSVDLITFGTARSVTLKAGVNVIFLDRWQDFREAIFRITTTANDKIEIIDADLRVGFLID